LARQTVASWFEAHPNALTHLTRYRSEGGSWRQCVSVLRASHDYPFRDHTALMDYGHEGSVPAPPTKVEPPRHPAPTPTFRRSDRDLADLARSEDFFVTSAVNNCRGSEAIRAMEHWKAETQGTVVCNPVQYENRKPADPDTELDGDMWWAQELRDYMIEQEIRPHPSISLMTTKAAGTSANPVPARMNGLTKDRHAVFGHPQLTMRTVAAPHLPRPKIMYSSGAMTDPRYSDTITGDMANHHHSVGGVIVEIRGDRVHMREVVWDGECFIDVDKRYGVDGITKADRAEALVPGDVHSGYDDPAVEQAVFASNGWSLMDVTRPRRTIIHDGFNATACGQHENSPLHQALRWQSQTSNVQEELAEYGYLIERLIPDWTELYFPYDNHGDMGARWLHKPEHAIEPENLPFWWRTKADVVDAAAESEDFVNVLQLMMEAVCPNVAARATFLSPYFPAGSLRIKGVELGLHGDKASNGARGGAAALSKLATRLIAGHVHSPIILQGVYLAGIAALYQHGYNRGPSGWMQTMVGLLANGRRQMYHIVDGHFRG
jgi:hypothetical protein